MVEKETAPETRDMELVVGVLTKAWDDNDDRQLLKNSKLLLTHVCAVSLSRGWTDGSSNILITYWEKVLTALQKLKAQNSEGGLQASRKIEK